MKFLKTPEIVYFRIHVVVPICHYLDVPAIHIMVDGHKLLPMSVYPCMRPSDVHRSLTDHSLKYIKYIRGISEMCLSEQDKVCYEINIHVDAFIFMCPVG